VSVAVIIVAVIIAIAIFVAFLAGAVFGYGMRVREEQDAYRDERIRSALKHWHGHTTHKGCTIFSPDVVEGGIK
jgi:hypothetical protein